MQQYLGISDTFSFQEIETKGEKEFYISGYISTKSLDKFNDTITDDCLNDMLVQVKSGSIKIDFEHETIHNENLDLNPVARIVDAKLDTKGLWVKALLNSAHQRFNEISQSIKKGFLDSFSIAFKPLETATKYIQGKAVRILNKLKLINVGITGTPVNDDCKLDTVLVKALNEMELEWKNLDELDETELKHKYIKRTGKPGNYTYYYRDGSSSKSPKGNNNDDGGNDYDKNLEEFGKENADYKGTPDRQITVRKHTQNKDKWTAEYGQASSSQPLFDTKEEAIKEAQDYMKRFSIEKKALTTTSFPSHSSSNEEDNRQKMEEEAKPVEQETSTEEAKTEETTEEPVKTEESEVESVKEELAEVKSQLAKIQKELAKPEFKATQEPEPKTKLKKVTPLGLIG